MKRTKHGSVKTDGYDSKKEADYAKRLEWFKLAENPADRIVSVEKQVKFELIPAQWIGGKCVERACSYYADFRVEYADGRIEVIDVKSAHTKTLPAWVIKRKLMLHVHGIKVLEV